MWTMFDYTALRLPFYTTSSPQNLLLSKLLCFLCPLYPLGLFNATPAFTLLPLTVLLCVSFLLFQPVFLDLLPSFSPYYIFCLTHIINPSFYIFYSFIYLLHWPFAPLPMPVSVWVLCQPLCQDRGPATPASGGTERETGRAHSRCWTGVVLQLGCNLLHKTVLNYMMTFCFWSQTWRIEQFLHFSWTCTVWFGLTSEKIKHCTPCCQTTNLQASIT